MASLFFFFSPTLSNLLPSVVTLFKVAFYYKAIFLGILNYSQVFSKLVNLPFSK